MTQTKKLLFISTDFPYPPRDGSKIRTYFFLKNLCKEYKIHLLCFNNFSSENDRKMLSDMGINVCLIHKPKQTFLTVLKALFHFMPILFFRYRVKEYEVEVRRIYREVDFDAVHIDGLELADFCLLFNNSRTILDLRDGWSLLYKRKFDSAKNIHKIVAYLKLLMIQRMEKHVLSLPATPVLLSVSDKQQLLINNKDALKIQLVPNGVEIPSVSSSHENDIHDPFMVFTGAMDYPPNEEAILYFHKYIFPKIQQIEPDLKLVVAGRAPGKRIKDLKSDKIIITGEVTNIHEYVDKASVVVCPLLTGAGIKNKVLEAMALKKAIVSTSIGVEGICGTNGVHYIVNDNAQEFAESVCRLYSDKELCQKLGNNAFEYVKNNYTWEKCVDLLIQLYTKGVDSENF